MLRPLPSLLWDAASGLYRVRGSDTVGRLSATEVAELTEAADVGLLLDELSETAVRLAASGLLVFEEDAMALMASVLDEVSRSWERTFALIVMPTERCDLRCTYCYESFEKGRMKPSIQHGLLRLVDELTASYAAVDLAWFGGEPLLAVDGVVEVSDRLRSAAESNDAQVSVSMTTNGHRLTEQTRSRLRDRIDVYQITLDGPASIHDSQRVTIRGVGTYRTILENIRGVFEDTQSRVVLRINADVRRDGVGDRIADWLSAEIEPLHRRWGARLSISVNPVWDATTTSIDGICLNDAVEAQRLVRLIAAAEASVGSSMPSYMARTLDGLGTLSCYAGKPNSVVVGSDGQLYKCTVALDLEANQVGRLREDGTMDIDQTRWSGWVDQNAMSDPSCRRCAFARSCQGISCPLVRRQTGRPPCPTEKRHLGSMLVEAVAT